MPGHVVARSEQSLLLARPQRDAHRAAERHSRGFQNPHRLQHRAGAGPVVGRTRRRVPRVEVPADHHELGRLVGARNLADDVEHRWVGIVRVLDVGFDGDGNLLLEEACHAAVLFRWNHDLRKRPVGMRGGRSADRVDAVAARHGRERAQDPLAAEIRVTRTLPASLAAGRALRRGPARPAGSTERAAPARGTHAKFGRMRRARHGLELLRRIALGERAPVRRDVRSARSQHPFALQRAGRVMLLEILESTVGNEDDVAADEAVRSRCPGGRGARNGKRLRRDRLDVELLVRPAARETATRRIAARRSAGIRGPLPAGHRGRDVGRTRRPRLLRDVGQSPRPHLVDGPVGRLLQVR